MTRIVSLFTGVAGLDMAVATVTRGHVVAHAETDPGACKILAARYPDVPNLGDATVVDWTPWVGQIDAVCAGFSCQDISHAGEGKGITDDTRSGVTWGATIRAVRALRPRRVYLENVRAILARGLTRVASDLAALGYVGRYACVRASDVGAPHRRDRWFAVAYPEGEQVGAAGLAWHGAGRAAADAEDGQPGVPQGDGERAPVGVSAVGTGGGVGAGDSSAGVRVVGRGAGPQREAAADTGVDGRVRGAQPNVGTVEPGQQPSRRGDPDRRDTPAADTDSAGPQGHGRPVERPREQSAATGHRPAAADTDDVGQQRGGRTRRRRPGPAHDSDTAWGEFAPAIHRWETILGRPAPPPTDTRGRLNPDFVEWMVGLPAGWTDVEGVSRSQRLRCLGNIAMPAQAAHAYQLLAATDDANEAGAA